jgi:hypothetical protein
MELTIAVDADMFQIQLRNTATVGQLKKQICQKLQKQFDQISVTRAGTVFDTYQNLDRRLRDVGINNFNSINVL